MSEVDKAAGSNPFDPETFSHGGGLWDGKTVTITSAVAKAQALSYGDGKPVIDDKTKTQSIQTGLFLKGIAEGDEKEREESYGVGDRVVPLPDGRGFQSKDGGPLKFHANSGIAKLSAALKAAGFDLGNLIERNADGSVTQRMDRLVGARFVMRGEQRLGRDGKPLKDKKGYDKMAFYPATFVGYVAGQGGVASTGGNGAVAAAPAGALAEKAAGAVTVALTAAKDGKLNRADLVRTLAAQLAGDPESNAIIGLVVRDDFHKGQKWAYDGVTASL
jgi:hypothetical protein